MEAVLQDEDELYDRFSEYLVQCARREKMSEIEASSRRPQSAHVHSSSR